MPRRLILSAAERTGLLSLPNHRDDLIRFYIFDEADLSLIRQRRGKSNRLGFAVHLCYLRYPGCALPTDIAPSIELLTFVAEQLQIDPGVWQQYAQRSETRREHAVELQSWLNLSTFGRPETQQHERPIGRDESKSSRPSASTSKKSNPASIQNRESSLPNKDLRRFQAPSGAVQLVHVCVLRPRVCDKYIWRDDEANCRI